ncbi:hypothetical protein WJX72_002606 [[Myrmecia] bisecta]|uniref:Tubulin-tyrosine ligase n=1 Tax=[Myrmecia] bisecta TaxID=41462 RepID=A0AAW1Q0L6_9CHLO
MPGLLNKPKEETGTPYKYVVLPGNESSLMQEAIGARSWWQATKKEGPCNFWWGGNAQKYPWSSFGQGASKLVVNQVEGHSEVCTKTRLAENVRRYAEANQMACLWIPQTHILTAGPQGARGLDLFRKAVQRSPCTSGKGPGNVWIVKPSGRNRGNGIEVMDSLEAVEKHLKNARNGSQWVVQKYIENPMLVGGRKFDIRAYALMTPEGKILMYNNSYVRTSSTPFSLDNLADRSVHLTNDAVQKHIDNYGAFEEANKMTMEDLQRVLGDKVDVQGDIVPQMWECAKHVFSAVLSKLNPKQHQHCFELFGLDFMIDEANRVYLIEVNTSPALYRCCRILKEMLPPVIEEVVQKCIDPLFPPPEDAQQAERLDGFKMLLDAGDARKTARLLRKSSSGASYASRTSNSTASSPGSSPGSSRNNSLKSLGRPATESAPQKEAKAGGSPYTGAALPPKRPLPKKVSTGGKSSDSDDCASPMGKGTSSRPPRIARKITSTSTEAAAVPAEAAEAGTPAETAAAADTSPMDDGSAPELQATSDAEASSATSQGLDQSSSDSDADSGTAGEPVSSQPKDTLQKSPRGGETAGARAMRKSTSSTSSRSTGSQRAFRV